MFDKACRAAALAIVSGLALALACGGRGQLLLPADQDNGGFSATDAGSAASGGIAGSAVGGTTGLGSGGTSAADSGAGGGADAGPAAGSPPDFDFTRQPNLAVSYQIDPAHSGAQPDSKFVPPLVRRWSYVFGGAVSYPLIASGRVFVTAKDEGNQDTRLYALDANTGTVLWQSQRIGEPVRSLGVNPAYDRGRVFAASNDGTLVAFDAGSGQIAWTMKLPGVYAFTTPPVATGGAVFITGAANSRSPVFAIDGRTGRVVYDVDSIGGRPLTLGESSLFNGAGCYETDALDARTGEQLWHFKTGCFGGGSEPTTYHRGQLFVPGSAITVLDAITGAQRRFMLNGFWAPACAGDVGFLVVGSELSGVDLRDARTRWTLALGPSGSRDDSPIMPPVVVSGFVYVVTSKGLLSAVDAEAGQVVWSDQVAAEDPGWVNGGGTPMQAIGAGEERLVVPFERGIYAYF